MQALRMTGWFVAVFLAETAWSQSSPIRLVSSQDRSIASSSTPGGHSIAPRLSRDGRFLVFVSEAPNLVTNDHNGSRMDVFVEDLATRNITLVSATPHGESGNDASYAPSISADGRYVAFLSRASNLIAGYTNRFAEVFVRDLQQGSSQVVSIASDSGPADADCTAPILSSDGLVVCFASRARNLVEGKGNPQLNLFVRDLKSGRTEGLTQGKLERLADPADVKDYSLSDDGTLLAFSSAGTNQVATPTIGLLTTGFVHDRRSGVTSRLVLDGVPRTENPSIDVGTVESVAFAPGGHLLAFRTSFRVPPAFAPSNVVCRVDWDAETQVLIPGQPTLGGQETAPPIIGFALDGRTMAFVQASVLGQDPVLRVWNQERGLVAVTNAATGDFLRVGELTLSPDARYVAFTSTSTNLLGASAPTPPLTYQLYLMELATGGMILVSADAAGQPVGGVDDASPQFSPDSRVLVFQSNAAGLVPDDRNQATDIFGYDIAARKVSLLVKPIASPTATAAGSSSLVTPGVSLDGRYILLASTSTDLVAGDPGGARGLFVRDLATGEIKLANVLGDAFDQARIPFAEAVLSGNGRFVAFNSELPVTNHAGVVLKAQQVFVRDLALGQTHWAMLNTNGVPTQGHSAFQLKLSADGRYVAFFTSATDLVAGSVPSTSADNAVLRDLTLGMTYLIMPSFSYSGQALALAGLGGRAVAAAGSQSNVRVTLFDPTTGRRDRAAGEPGSIPVLSRDGRRVAILTPSSRFNVNPGLNWQDLPDGPWHRVSFESRPGSTYSLEHLSADGRFVVVRESLGLRPGSSGLVWLVDLASGGLQNLAVLPDGTASNEPLSRSASLSADNRLAVFQSVDAGVIHVGERAPTAVFLRDLKSQRTTLLSGSAGKSSSSEGSFSPAMSANGRTVAFNSWSDGLAEGDFNLLGDVFAAELPPSAWADSDGDTLDDLWELAWFGNLLRDGRGDYDSDGLSEIAEQVAGTSPINDASVFRLAATIDGRGVAGLSWTTEPGRTYRVQVKASLGEAWVPVGDSVPGDGRPVRLALPAITGSQSYFQVAVSAEPN